MSFELQAYLQHHKQAIENYLKEHFSQPLVSSRLSEGMRYSLEAGGKRLRPILTIAACEAAKGDAVLAMPVAAALECIHTYSLVHDDLPAMDDDDLRRGKPTNHKKFGEATAILVGDGLLSEAFRILAQPSELPASVQLNIIERIASSAGNFGMVAGQQLDLQHEARTPTLESLQQIHAHKTGKLLTVSVESGALVAGVTESELVSYSQFGAHLGVAFQIVDDVLDVIGGAEIGKSQKSDLKHAKATYVSLLGVDESKKQAKQEIGQALAAIESLGDGATALRAIARFVIDRKF